MKYYVIEPEVAGSWAENTVVADRSVHPPQITKLHYEFDGWDGDAIAESFPVYLVTREAMEKILQIKPTGVSFDDVEVTTSDQFRHFYPNLKLPEFVWLKVEGQAGHDDFGIVPYRDINAIADPELCLVISQRILDILAALGITYADVREYDGPKL